MTSTEYYVRYETLLYGVWGPVVFGPIQDEGKARAFYDSRVDDRKHGNIRLVSLVQRVEQIIAEAP